MDPERVCFPVLGWICVCFLAAGHPSASVQGTLWPSRVLSRLGTVVILLCSAWMPFQTLGIVHLQKQVLEALRNSSIPWEQSPRVLVQDPSNQLGRLYTFQPPHLQLAWSALRREGTPSLASTHDDDQHPPVDYRVVLRARGGWWGYFSTWEVVETESFLPPTVLTDRRPAAPAPVRTIPD